MRVGEHTVLTFCQWSPRHELGAKLIHEFSGLVLLVEYMCFHLVHHRAKQTVEETGNPEVLLGVLQCLVAQGVGSQILECLFYKCIFRTRIPKHRAIANESKVPVSTYSDFSSPLDASLKRRIDFAAIKKPMASY